ncbi:MAG: DUF6364 family protein [Lentisphaeria bacterium]|nr:DUF6364 family protein [Lentisphaeria bacterium]
MSMTKLTLSAPSEIVKLAESLAKERKTSISAMFANYVRSQASPEGNHLLNMEPGSITASISGVVKLPEDFNEKDFMSQVLSEKYGL